MTADSGKVPAHPLEAGVLGGGGLSSSAGGRGLGWTSQEVPTNVLLHIPSPNKRMMFHFSQPTSEFSWKIPESGSFISTQ